MTGASSSMPIVVARDAARDGGPDGGRLLVHLLGHEVLVAALLGGLDGPVDALHRPLALDAVEARDDDRVRVQVGDVALLEEDDPAGVGEHRRDVRGEQVLALAEAHDEGHVVARADEPVGLAAVEDRDRVGTPGPPERRAHGGRDVARVGLLDEVGEDLGVGLGGEPVAPREEAVAELPEVLDDAVVDDRHVARAVHVGMGVEVVGPAVGGPAGMGEADRGRGRGIEQRRPEVGQLARPLLDEQLARGGHERDARRVVAPVLQAREALEQDGRRVPWSDVSDDAAHAWRSPLSWAGSDVPRRVPTGRRRARAPGLGPLPRP